MIGTARELTGGLITSRRRFLTTASAAAAGLMIRPLHVGAAPVNWGNIGQFFTKFATGMLFQFLGAGMPAGFGGIAQNLLGLFNKHEYIPGCFGNGQSGGALDRILNLIGSLERRNIGTAFLKQNSTETSGAYPGASTVGLSFVTKEVLAQALSDLLGRTNVGDLTPQQIEQLKRKYFLPLLQGDFENIARETLRKVTPLADPYRQLFQTEAGALVYIGYEPGSTPNKNRGEGETTIRVIPPGARQNAVMRYVNRNSNYWSNDQVRKEFINTILHNNRINQNAKQAFEYEYPS
jgi:hypothetical protein